MADNVIEIEVRGVEKLVQALDRAPDVIRANMAAAAKEAGSEIINTEGLKVYPPETDANKPPEPYYIRGVGMQRVSGNNFKSEKYGSKFYVKTEGYGAIIGNSASYAKYLADEEDQATHMAKIGWRKLIDVARDKMQKIKKIFQAWVDKTIRDLGL